MSELQVHLSIGNDDVACHQPGGIMVTRWALSNCPGCLETTPAPERIEIDGRWLLEHAVRCPECSGPCALRVSKAGNPFYGCVRWPECTGTAPSRSDGTPDVRRGQTYSAPTRPVVPLMEQMRPRPAGEIAALGLARQRFAQAFEDFWKKQGVAFRDAMFWLRRQLGLRDNYFISDFTMQQLEQATDAVLDFDGDLQEWLIEAQNDQIAKAEQSTAKGEPGT